MMKKLQPKVSLPVEQLSPGVLLIAKPLIPEEEYRRTIVLIVRHDEDGTAGLILNRPSLLPVHAMFDMLPVLSPIYIGGPLEAHLVTFLHDIPAFDDAIPIGNGLFWGGNHDYLETKVVKREGMHKRLRFFAGITSWHPGQLERELHQDYWWKAGITASELFNDHIYDLRSYTLLRDDNLFGVLQDVPDPVMS